MKALKIISLGIAIWGLSLIWPEINQSLTGPVTINLIIGLGIVILAYVIAQHLDWYHNHHNPGQDNRSRPNHSSRPVPVN